MSGSANSYAIKNDLTAPSEYLIGAKEISTFTMPFLVKK